MLLGIAACASAATGSSKGRFECPSPVSGTAITARRGAQSVTITALSWSATGGEVGDVRSINGDVDDDAFINAYCALASWKLTSVDGLDRCVAVANEQSGVELFLPGMEAAASIPNCRGAQLHELRDRLLGEFMRQLPPAELPSLAEYRQPISADCSTPSDFTLEVSGVEGTASVRAGLLRNEFGQGRVRRSALDSLACDLLRYRVDLLPRNEEGRALICREDTERRYAAEVGVWVYEGLAVDYVAHGRTTQLRIGLCPAPLESVYRKLEALLIAPASVLEPD